MSKAVEKNQSASSKLWNTARILCATVISLDSELSFFGIILEFR